MSGDKWFFPNNYYNFVYGIRNEFTFTVVIDRGFTKIILEQSFIWDFEHPMRKTWNTIHLWKFTRKTMRVHFLAKSIS